MPAPKYPYRIMLRPETLDLMAAAMGDGVMTGFGGKPSRRILLGTNTTGTASALINGKNDPSSGAMATIGVRLARAKGMAGWDDDAIWDAIRETHKIVRVDEAAEAAA
jgi:hypothetical protein